MTWHRTTGKCYDKHVNLISWSNYSFHKVHESIYFIIFLVNISAKEKSNVDLYVVNVWIIIS